MNKNEEFNLDHQWDLYLQRVGLKGKSMPVNQYREMKQTFFGACGQMLILLRDELSELEEEEAMKVYQDLINQVGAYFLKASGREN